MLVVMVLMVMVIVMVMVMVVLEQKAPPLTLRRTTADAMQNTLVL